MMTSSSLRAFIALFVVAIFVGSGSANAQSLDPAFFFGGTNNGAYLEWLQESSFERAEFLPSPAGNETGAALHWTIKDDQIFLAMAAKAEGWISFGIAESGGMYGADVVTFMASTESLVDGYIEDERAVLRDDCQSWTLLNAVNEGGFLIFEAVRALDTGDTQDRPIMEDSEQGSVESRIIAAWSDSPTLENHGPNNRASTALRFHGTQEGDDFELAMANEAEGIVVLMAQDYNIKPIETEYVDFCFTYADMIAQGLPENVELHAIGFVPIIDPRSAKYVHHFVLQASMEGDPTDGGGCSEMDYTDIAYLWGPGEGPHALPSNVGSPLGENGFKSFQLQVHYNNPWLDEGILDSSGVHIYYTSNKREHDMGVMMLGDPIIRLMNAPVGNGLSAHKFDCPGSCSTATMDGHEKVTVLRESLHMHKTGVAMSNEHMRDGEVIRVGKSEYYDYSQQGAYTVQQPPFEVLPGDSFRTTCQYEVNDDTVFGRSTQEEMCIAFLTYYPRIARPTPFGFDIPFICGYNLQLPNCASEWEQVDLGSKSELDRAFGSSSETCQGEVNAGEENAGEENAGEESAGEETEGEENVGEGNAGEPTSGALFASTVGSIAFALIATLLCGYL